MAVAETFTIERANHALAELGLPPLSRAGWLELKRVAGLRGQDLVLHLQRATRGDRKSATLIANSHPGLERGGGSPAESTPAESPPTEAAPARIAEGDEARPQPTSVAASPRRHRVTVYGKDETGGVAVRFSLREGRSPRHPAWTINFEVARARGERTQDGLDWQNAIVVMLVPYEIQLMLAVLLGMLPSARFAGHGEDHRKWFELGVGRDGSAMRLTVADGHDRRAVSIGPTDIGAVIALFSRAFSMQTGAPPVSAESILSRVTALHEARRNRQS